MLIVNRGDCTFVTKAYYAEYFGASAVIIVDNTEEDLDDIIVVDDHSCKNYIF